MPEPVDVQLDGELIGADGEAELIARLVADGARVAAGTTLAEFTTSKASFEVEAPASGVLRWLASEGALVKPNEPFARIEQ